MFACARLSSCGRLVGDTYHALNADEAQPHAGVRVRHRPSLRTSSCHGPKPCKQRVDIDPAIPRPPSSCGCSPWRSFGNSFERSEEHTSELQSRPHRVCRLLLEKKKES